MSNKRDFGSFHSSNVQELIALNEAEYEAPSLPIDLLDLSPLKHNRLLFGEEAKKHFLIEKKYTFLNHGAFGGVLREALEASQIWQRYAETQPLRFYDRELLPLLVHVTRRLAKFVDCEPEDIVLVTNATTGINTVVRSIKFKPGDVIFILSSTYGAVKKLLRQVCLETGAVLQEAQVNFPLSGPQQIVDLVTESIDGGKTKLALFDHIPSNTPYITPVGQLIDICHKSNIPVLIDGAHAPGSLPLSIQSIKSDFYVSNAHKWLCSPKGAAFLYVDKKYQESTRPLIISHGFGSGFNSEFIWAGLHDYSPFLALHTVLDFWLTVGAVRIRSYMYDTIKQAATLLTETWGTGLVAPMSMFGSMALVELPALPVAEKTPTLTYNQAEEIQNTLYYKFDIEVPIKAVQGKLYVRISAHIYNTLEDFQKLANAVKQIADGQLSV